MSDCLGARESAPERRSSQAGCGEPGTEAAAGRQCQPAAVAGSNEEFGAGEEIRTPDPRITNALLYQLSYPGEGAEV
jgi:hypothetical protein